MAAHSVCATGSNAGDWISGRSVARGASVSNSGIEAGAQRDRLLRRPEREYRVPLGTINTTACRRMAAELVNRKVAVIVAGPIPAALAAKAARGRHPDRFRNRRRSGGRADWWPASIVQMATSQALASSPPHWSRSDFELLQEVAPNVAVIAVLLNPQVLGLRKPGERRAGCGSLHRAADCGRNASSERDIEIAFATIAQQRVGAILIGSDPFFTDRRSQLVALAAHHGIAAIYQLREFAEAGGLMSYGTSLTDAYRSVGVYAGRILQGNQICRSSGSAIHKSRAGHQSNPPGCSGSPFHCRFRAAPTR